MPTPRLRSVLIFVLLLVVLAAAAGLGGAGTAPRRRPARRGHHPLVQLRPRRQGRHGRRLGADGLQQRLVGQQLRLPAGRARRRDALPVRQAAHVGRRARGRHQRAPAGRQLYGTATTLDTTVLAADPYVKKGYGGEIWDTHPAAVHHGAAGDRRCSARWRRPGSRPARPAASPSPIPTRRGSSSCSAATTGSPSACPDNAFLAHPNMVTVRQIDLADTGQLPRLVRPADVRPEHRPLQPRRRPVRRRLGLPRPRRPAVVLQHQPSVGRVHTVAPSLGLTPDDALRDASRVRRPRRTRSPARTSRRSAATTTRARPSTRRRTTR